jgi:hypothetical protein
VKRWWTRTSTSHAVTELRGIDLISEAEKLTLDTVASHR